MIMKIKNCLSQQEKSYQRSTDSESEVIVWASIKGRNPKDHMTYMTCRANSCVAVENTANHKETIKTPPTFAFSQLTD